MIYTIKKKKGFLMELLVYRRAVGGSSDILLVEQIIGPMPGPSRGKRARHRLPWPCRERELKDGVWGKGGMIINNQRNDEREIRKPKRMETKVQFSLPLCLGGSSIFSWQSFEERGKRELTRATSMLSLLYPSIHRQRHSYVCVTSPNFGARAAEL